ncbi:beta-lactamase hydrolase domain-containing protein [Dendronalium sp. ChiSLP03b]|uniref:beta-lactamase hydrolase domain-containing protein n=1 Tax=Dendronalium sp. ChiSLP03b TaxID=3075381 RepID=UPI002AD3230E|nr:sulfur transferase domain-containing protein [Dendronalium sp. ChiSLP03b]MDZ8208577.1 sulfur transferase domain-containing protein [Dendronalium sp. ChiSLP03b]
MNTIRKINNELAIAGQITPEQFQHIAEDGYKSVLNLRLANEKGMLDCEQEKIEILGLFYVNLPTKAEEINHQVALQIFKIINQLPKPILIHCDNSLRSAAIVLLYIATKQGIAFEQVFQITIRIGLL